MNTRPTLHRLGSLLSSLLLLALTARTPLRADYASTVQALGPVGYWRLNETNNSPGLKRLANLGELGSAADGYAVLTAATGLPGRVGSCVRLYNSTNALGWCGSKVDINYHPTLNKSGSFSVEFWVKPNTLGADATGFCPLSSMMNDFGASSRSGYLFYINNTGRVEFRLGNASGYVGTVNNANQPLGRWVAHTRNVVADFRMAFAGEFDSVPAITAVLVGGDSDNTGGHSIGYVDDVSLKP